jgi:hypothetical protein
MRYHVAKSPGLFPQSSFTPIRSRRFRKKKSTVNWFFRNFGFGV